MSNMIKNEAGDNFNKARTKEVFSRILNLLKISDQSLLSLDEVRGLLKPKGESYRGLQAVPVNKIIGSEGRYRDFNKSFLPRHDHLRNRWVRVDEAHLQSIILPAIQLYEIGGVFFVRDGNHRVSVAALQGVLAIDAEVISLNSEISIDPAMSKEDLRRAVIAYEKQEFCKKIPFHQIIPDCDIEFSATGRYAELLQHIYGHKYYINQNYTEEIPIEKAVQSWYENVYLPILEIINENSLLVRFPQRTVADLYVWTVKHWHELKEKCGEEYPVHEAILHYSETYGMSLKKRIYKRLHAFKQRLLLLLKHH